MILTASICFLTVATGCSMIPPPGKIQTKSAFVGTDIADQRREKRSVFFTTGAVSWGIKVVKTLLKQARSIPSDGIYRNYVKAGGWNQAAKDFKYATNNPSLKTAEMPQNHGFISGQAGDRFVVLKSHGDRGKPEIEITKFREDRKGGRVFTGEKIDRITYED